MLSSLFRINTEPSKGVIDILKKTTLGSNGGLYQHLNTEARVLDLDNPLFLTLERNDKVLGNVTFCRRSGHWYIRYFAFQSIFQSTGKHKSRAGGKSKIKNELKLFFEDALKTGFKGEKISEFYAYVDPENVKSLWLTEELGFKTIREIELRTFSRVAPKNKIDVVRSGDWSEIPEFIISRLQKKDYFFLQEFMKGEYYVVKNETEEIICFAKITNLDWRIERLPGKFGKTLTKVIPFIPGINRIIRPKKHSFVIPEGVYIKDNCSNLLNDFFNSILAEEKRNLILWWVDPIDGLYSTIKNKIKWGVLNKLIGVTQVNVISKTLNNKSETSKQSFHISGTDMG
ncbi:MAG: hypothetical protein KC454_09025 [Flavobacteriales bacterium]|nr:hypothetical protein [Flavobacteriales bacterium]